MSARLWMSLSGLVMLGLWSAGCVGDGEPSRDAFGEMTVDSGEVDSAEAVGEDRGESPELCPSVDELLAEVAHEDFDGDTLPNGLDDDDDDDGVPDHVDHDVSPYPPAPPFCPELWNVDWAGGSNGFDTDADDDTLCDGFELALGTDPRDRGSGPCNMLEDGLEAWLGFDPSLPCDVEQAVFGDRRFYAGRIWDRPYPDNPRSDHRFPDTVWLSAREGARRAIMRMRQHSPPFLGINVMDLSREITYISVSPGGGTVDGDAIVDLRAGATVWVRPWFDWPEDLPVPPCSYYAWWLKIWLEDESGTPVSDELDAVLTYAFLVVWDEFAGPMSITAFGTEQCGLFPECPPREW